MNHWNKLNFLNSGKGPLSLPYRRRLEHVQTSQTIDQLYIPLLGKITEKAVLRQFNRYVENKMPNYISVYKEGCSTEMVLLYVSDNILMNMDRQRITLMVCTDLLAAFSTVHLDIMIAVLEVSYGLIGNVLNWCNSYQRGCSVGVKIKDTISD